MHKAEEKEREEVISNLDHFKRDAEIKAKKITEELRDEFLKLCDEMCRAVTVDAYDKIHQKLHDMINTDENILSWLNWWHSRRSHTFKAFRGFFHSGTNMAEIGNAKWKKSGKKLRLVDACWDDITTMFTQAEDLDDYYLHK